MHENCSKYCVENNLTKSDSINLCLSSVIFLSLWSLSECHVIVLNGWIEGNRYAILIYKLSRRSCTKPGREVEPVRPKTWCLRTCRKQGPHVIEPQIQELWILKEPSLSEVLFPVISILYFETSANITNKLDIVEQNTIIRDEVQEKKDGVGRWFCDRLSRYQSFHSGGIVKFLVILSI